MSAPVYVTCEPQDSLFRQPDLTFPDILSEPLVRLIMRADGVDPKMLEVELGRIARGLADAGPLSPKEGVSRRAHPKRARPAAEACCVP